ncbi:MAG TPA: hypothetical protein VEC37_09485, partial [Bacillota bacterium]|nr:hypothetical protein [Bacillota bacterium]
MKIKFHVLAESTRPGLHIWDEKDSHFPLRYLHPVAGPENNWWLFESELDQNLSIGFKLFEWNERKNKPQAWESADETFNRVIMLNPGEQLPGNVWVIQGSSRIMFDDPLVQTGEQLQIHLITKKAYRYGKLYAWIPGQTAFTIEPNGEDSHGPYYNLNLQGNFRYTFNFKFIESDGSFEPDFANRTWSSADGTEVWTHSKGAAVIRKVPEQHRLNIHLRHEWSDVPVKMHLWQEASDYQEDLDGQIETDGWITYQTTPKLYSNLPYGVMFFKPGWQLKEDEQARRYVRLNHDAEYWTLEGSNVLFSARPERTKQVIVEITGKAPECGFATPDSI